MSPFHESIFDVFGERLAGNLVCSLPFGACGVSATKTPCPITTSRPATGREDIKASLSGHTSLYDYWPQFGPPYHNYCLGAHSTIDHVGDNSRRLEPPPAATVQRAMFD
jgi:hypothetical protein